MKKNEYFIFTDGACIKNPGPGAWAAVIFERQASGKRVVELGEYCGKTTNNQMELTAVIKALEFIKSSEANIRVFSDSKYVVKGILEWLPAWQKKAWKTSLGKDVLNKELWQKLYTEILKKNSCTLNFTHVPSHVGLEANERADYIASTFIKDKSLMLYEGDEKKYIFSLDTENLDKRIEILAKNKKLQKSKKAFSYLSMINKKIVIHKTWNDCYERVKGQSNARFKKATSSEEEKKIIEEWKKT